MSAPHHAHSPSRGRRGPSTRPPLDRRAARARVYRRRRIAAALVALVALALLGVFVASAWPSSGPSVPPTPAAIRSIEAGVATWQLPAPISREAVVANGAGFTILGGLDASGASVATVLDASPATGAIRHAGILADRKSTRLNSSHLGI